MEELSRRNFLKSASVAAVGAAALGVVGCAPAAEPAGAATKAVNDIKWDEEFDIIAVGAGLAGASTAATVALQGDGATCLLIEKSSSASGGGNSMFSAGEVLMTDEAHREEFFTYMKSCRGDFDSSPDDVLEAYATKVSTVLDFFKQLGLEESDYITLVPGEFVPQLTYPEYPELDGSRSVGRVRVSGGRFKHVREFMGWYIDQHPDTVTQKTNAAITSLVQDPETKEILGIVYDNKGKEVHAKANKGVVMCCGSFENNPTMMQDYFSMPVCYPAAGVHNTGDGIKIVLDVGADLWHMNTIEGFWTNPRKLDESAMGPNVILNKLYGITVGINGRRFYYDYDVSCAPDALKSPGGGDVTDLALGWGTRHGHNNFGGEWPHQHLPAKSWFIVDEEHWEMAVSTSISHWGIDMIKTLYSGVNELSDLAFTTDIVGDGWGYSAGTIEELAAKIDVPADELTRTVEVWNRYVEQGFDEAFYRPAEWMTKIEKAPFYAIYCVPTFVNTDGGPVRNANGQVIDREGNPIPNLYAAGEFGSVWSNMYNGGGNLAERIAFGRITVEHALGK